MCFVRLFAGWFQSKVQGVLALVGFREVIRTCSVRTQRVAFTAFRLTKSLTYAWWKRKGNPRSVAFPLFFPSFPLVSRWLPSGFPVLFPSGFTLGNPLLKHPQMATCPTPLRGSALLPIRLQLRVDVLIRLAPKRKYQSPKRVEVL